MDNYIKNHQAGNWWVTVSGAGTPNAAVESWADDKDRHRSGTMLYNSTISGISAAGGTTYSGVTDMYNHSDTNQPADVYIGRQDGHTGRELDAPKLV